ITLTFSASGFLEYLNKQLEEQGNSTAQQIFSAIDTDNAEMYAAVILGADDLPIANQVFLNLALEGSEFDLGAMDPSMPAGTMASLDLVLSMSQSTVLSDHNSTELVPAVAPEAVAE